MVIRSIQHSLFVSDSELLQLAFQQGVNLPNVTIRRNTVNHISNIFQYYLACMSIYREIYPFLERKVAKIANKNCCYSILSTVGRAGLELLILRLAISCPNHCATSPSNVTCLSHLTRSPL